MSGKKRRKKKGGEHSEVGGTKNKDENEYEPEVKTKYLRLISKH